MFKVYKVVILYMYMLYMYIYMYMLYKYMYIFIYVYVYVLTNLIVATIYTIRLVNTSVTSHDYSFVCVCGEYF